MTHRYRIGRQDQFEQMSRLSGQSPAYEESPMAIEWKRA